MNLTYQIEGGDFTRAGYVSSQIKRVLKQLSLDPQTIKRIVIALYEAEVNVVAHACRGMADSRIEPDRIVVRLEDEGPGIPDIAQAMQEGYSTASERVREMGFGAGMGLPNMKKNVDELDISSVVGQGTTITMLFMSSSSTFFFMFGLSLIHI